MNEIIIQKTVLFWIQKNWPINIKLTKTYGYRIPYIQGLIYFNHKMSVNCFLSPLVPNFVEQGLKNLKPTGMTMLWDTLIFACDELVKFNTGRFKNAVNRILVISDGEDIESQNDLKAVAKKMIQNKIIDSVIVSKKRHLQTTCCIVLHDRWLSFSKEENKVFLDSPDYFKIEFSLKT